MKRRISTMLSPNLVIGKDGNVTVEEEVARYHDAEYFAMLGHAISGGIESPLQFMLQVNFTLVILRLKQLVYFSQ
jgi:hypothetical protein